MLYGEGGPCEAWWVGCPGHRNAVVARRDGLGPRFVRGAAHPPRYARSPSRQAGGSADCNYQAALRSTSLRSISVSRICTVLSAAPLRRLSDTTHSESPFS